MDEQTKPPAAETEPAKPETKPPAAAAPKLKPRDDKQRGPQKGRTTFPDSYRS